MNKLKPTHLKPICFGTFDSEKTLCRACWVPDKCKKEKEKDLKESKTKE